MDILEPVLAFAMLFTQSEAVAENYHCRLAQIQMIMPASARNVAGSEIAGYGRVSCYVSSDRDQLFFTDQPGATSYADTLQHRLDDHLRAVRRAQR